MVPVAQELKAHYLVANNQIRRLKFLSNFRDVFFLDAVPADPIFYGFRFLRRNSVGTNSLGCGISEGFPRFRCRCQLRAGQVAGVPEWVGMASYWNPVA